MAHFRTPIEMLIQILSHGGSIKVPDEGEYLMSSDGDFYLFVDGYPKNIDLSLKDLIQMANKVGRDELWLKCCSLSLGKSH